MKKRVAVLCIMCLVLLRITGCSDEQMDIEPYPHDEITVAEDVACMKKKPDLTKPPL